MLFNISLYDADGRFKRDIEMEFDTEEDCEIYCKEHYLIDGEYEFGEVINK